MNNKKKAVLVIIIVIIAGGGVGGFLAWYYLTNQNVPACTTLTPFSAYPVNMTKIQSITPLGNLNPPAHTYPTDHMYFYPNATAYPNGFEVFAPGNMTITLLSRVNYNPPQTLNITDDYSIDFVVCRELTARFGHVINLSAQLWNKIGTFGSSGDKVQTWEVAGRHYTSYAKSVSIPVTPGMLLGIAGIGGAMDFWLKDTRVTLSWVNHDWPSEFQNTVAALDYFTPALKAKMVTYLRDYLGNPVVPANYTGKIDWDVAGTVRGIWVRGDYTPGQIRAEDIGLSLVYSNYNASKGAISIGIAGNSTWDQNVYTFTPLHTGFANRAFADVTPDGNIYYYFCEQFGTPGSYTKVILLKMDDASHVRLQFVNNGLTPLPADPRSFWCQSASVVYDR